MVRLRDRWPSFAVFLLALAACFWGWLPLARFESEQIDIHVSADHIVVDGTYFYRNPYPVAIIQGMSIPLPTDTLHPLPVELSIEELSPEQRPVPFRELWGRPRFELRLGPRETVCVRVHYYQQAPDANARYILTTTQPWLRPLRAGEYRLIPEGVAIVQSNYPLAPLAQGIVHFEQKQFMPVQDWIFSWRRPTPTQ